MFDVQSSAPGLSPSSPVLEAIALSTGLDYATVQAVLSAFGTVVAKSKNHDDDLHDDHHQTSSSSESKAESESSSNPSSPMDSLTSLGVLAPIARRLSDQYPADYLLAWCEYVQRHQAEITRPGGYLYRTITAGDWPPEPPPAVEVGPRPAPQAPRPAPKVQAKGGPTNQPSPDVEDRRLSERRRSIEIEAYIRADPERHESLRQEARRLLARDLAQVPVKWHGGHVAARVNELVAERLGFREARS